MAVSSFWYGQGLLKALTKEIDYVADDIRVQLHTASYVPNQDTHVYRSDLTNELATGGGYTAGGVVLASKTRTYTAGTNTITLDAADSSWAAATFTARYAVILDATPATDATKPLLGYVDFGQNFSPANQTLTIAWAASGLLIAVMA